MALHREEIPLSILTLIENAGTQLAYTSMVSYLTADTPNDPEKTRVAEAVVAHWREHAPLP